MLRCGSIIRNKWNRHASRQKHPKLSADERAFLNRLDCLNEEEIKRLTTREIFAYFKIIDKVDSRADVRRMVERAN